MCSPRARARPQLTRQAEAAVELVGDERREARLVGLERVLAGVPLAPRAHKAGLEHEDHVGVVGHDGHEVLLVERDRLEGVVLLAGLQAVVREAQYGLHAGRAQGAEARVQLVEHALRQRQRRVRGGKVGVRLHERAIQRERVRQRREREGEVELEAEAALRVAQHGRAAVVRGEARRQRGARAERSERGQQR